MAVSYTFYKNDGTSVSEQLPHMPATPFPDPAADFGWSVQGKTFKGWNKESDGSGTFYYTGDTILTGTTFYAIWEAPVITYLTTDRDLTSVANAIRAKSGGSADLAFPAGFVSEIGNIPSGGGGNFTLIGTKTLTLSEYTNQSATEETDTQIGISGTDYAFGYIVITCDGAITTTSEWGMSVALFTRYKGSSGNTGGGQAAQQSGGATLSQAAMVNNGRFTNAYGVWVKNNTSNIVICRKASSTYPKIRGGTYTVKVYGMTGI